MAAPTSDVTLDIAKLPIDPSAYTMSGDELQFFKIQTEIQDENELRAHILKVQAEAYAVYPYPCIRRCAFTAFKLAKYPFYDAVLKLGKERRGAIFFDLVGGDARKAIFDGYPRENVIVSDLHEEFWGLGKKLYNNSSSGVFPERFLAGDIFDPSFLSPGVPPAPTSATSPSPPPPLATLTSLTPLQHRISVIHAGAFFHLFDDVQQRHLAHLLASLLSPLPGSMIVGSHMGNPDIEEYKENGGWREFPLAGGKMFGHCVTSWKNLWAGKYGVFKPHEVVVWAASEEVERKQVIQAKGGDPSSLYSGHMVYWSVTRV